LLAKHHGGKFLLRVEDTDQERSVPGAIKFILDELAWFGIEPDEGPCRKELEAIGEVWDGAPDLAGDCGPYIQSLRLPRYKEVAEQLIASGHAYRCDCTPEMLERERNEQMARKETPGYSGYCRTRNVSSDTPHVVRFKMPLKRAVSFVDAVRGKVTWEQIPQKDTVILKSGGFPMYHLAVVVDDHDMRISHVLRGVEWLSSTPIHLLLYEALQWEAPIFAHLPVVNGPDGKKLSKRTGAANSRDVRERGFLAEAVLNFVSLIGWAPGEGSDQEIFTREELISKFSLAGVNPASGVFDMAKMEWINGLYIRKLPTGEFLERAMPFIQAAGLEIAEKELTAIAPYVQERVKLLTEVPPMVDFLQDKPLQRQMDAMFQKGVDGRVAAQILERAQAALEQLPDFSVAAIDQALREVATGLGLKPGPAFVALRIAVTGKTVTPPLFESFAVLGRDRVLSRISETLALIPKERSAAG
jgi:glutamyl-tRNA synthetase